MEAYIIEGFLYALELPGSCWLTEADSGDVYTSFEEIERSGVFGK